MIDPSLYSPYLAVEVWALLGAMALSLIAIAAIMWPRLRAVRHRADADTACNLPDGGYPSVSVIVYAHTDGDNLRTLLPQILGQDYPAPMEVIVVNDESDDDTETVVAELELRHPNLYMTFTPRQSRNLSRRKLSITLGIKAARHEALMLTCGNCRVESPLWLRSMMRHFAQGKEVVISHAAPTGPDMADTDRRPRRRAFDTQWAAMRYLYAAMHGRQLMGTGYNLAYSRHLFFDHKGFSRTLHLNYGDDDIFVNEIATAENTAVELSEASRVMAVEHAPAEQHDTYRMRRDFTARMLPSTHYRLMGFASLMWWLWPAFAAAACIMGWPSLIPPAITVVCSLAVIIPTMVMWRKTARALGLRPLLLTVPWLAWTRPARTLRYRLMARRTRRANLTHPA